VAGFSALSRKEVGITTASSFLHAWPIPKAAGRNDQGVKRTAAENQPEK